ncbi:MAG: formylmethanofuran dehydrogenase [Gammaproteobacteria bacterium]|nr:formylmethanofuran dehydrogenase [Gammaproteobacteria bacterium]
MSTKNQTHLYKDLACPFCSLHCDDLEVRNSAGKLIVEKNACSIATSQYEKPGILSTPMIFGEKTTLDKALAKAASILKNSNQPLFTGSASDVNGCRSLMALADKSGAIVDHLHGDSMVSNLRILQNKGWITTTLTEIKNRADLLIFIGTDASSRYPRFFERLVWDQPSLAGLKKNKRHITYIGDDLDIEQGKNPNGNKPTLIKPNRESINETLSILRALLKGTKIEENLIDSQTLTRLRKLVDLIRAANYGVLIWDPAEFSSTDGELSVQIISDLLRELNQKQRFAGLSLGGSDGGTTFNSVCTWQSGFPLRVNFSEKRPVHDMFAYSTKNLLNRAHVDSLLWLNNFDTSLSVPRTKIPRIMISRATRKISENIDVYIPIATPGLEHKGNLMRMDGVLSLPLRKLRESEHLSAAHILDKLRELA